MVGWCGVLGVGVGLCVWEGGDGDVGCVGVGLGSGMVEGCVCVWVGGEVCVMVRLLDCGGWGGCVWVDGGWRGDDGGECGGVEWVGV